MLYVLLMLVIVIGLFVTPVVYYLRWRNSAQPPTDKAKPSTYREWKD